MGKYLDLTGMRFERLVVIKRIGTSKHKSPLWKCKCDCGEICDVTSHGLRSSLTKSCGCYQRDAASIANKTHGLRHHKLYSVHKAMLRRCNDTRDPAFDRYGGRGISVCNSWSKAAGFVPFYQWAIENGYREGLTLDRINNNGNYEPRNCRWEDYGVQGRNKRIQKSNTTGVNGIQYRKAQGDYRVVISYNGKRYSCGCYKNLEDAVKARKEAELKYWVKGGDNNGS